MNPIKTGNPTPESLGPAPHDGNAVRADSVFNGFYPGTKITGALAVVALIAVGMTAVGYGSADSTGAERIPTSANLLAPNVC